jgi:2,4-dienoyl-CoA reductase-like NADH-dependent reductase (Old Yellow Enzyme family)
MVKPAVARNFLGVHVMSNQPLFTPYRMGDLDLPNRIVMAPLTRMRAQSHDHVPTTLQAEYYAQRASAGLIIADQYTESADIIEAISVVASSTTYGRKQI